MLEIGIICKLNEAAETSAAWLCFMSGKLMCTADLAACKCSSEFISILERKSSVDKHWCFQDYNEFGGCFDKSQSSVRKGEEPFSGTPSHFTTRCSCYISLSWSVIENKLNWSQFMTGKCFEFLLLTGWDLTSNGWGQIVSSASVWE